MIEDKMEWETVKMKILQQKSRNQDKIFKAHGACHIRRRCESEQIGHCWAEVMPPMIPAQKVLVGKPRPFRTQQKS